MALIRSGNTDSQLEIDSPSLAMRIILFNSLGGNFSRQGVATFGVSAIFTPPATPTDLLQIIGSESKVVRVYSIYFGTNNTAAGSQQFFLVKRSSQNIITTVNFVTPSVVPLDSGDTATAIVGHYITTTPLSSALGQSLGNINIVRWASPVASPGNFAGNAKEAGQEMLPWTANSNMDKFITLRGPNQVLAVNFNGAALVSGQTHTYRIIWTEADQ